MSFRPRPEWDLADGLFCAGVACVAGGAAWIYPPAGLLVVGTVLLVIAWPGAGKGAR